jgi:hypothetical protein
MGTNAACFQSVLCTTSRYTVASHCYAKALHLQQTCIYIRLPGMPPGHWNEGYEFITDKDG